MIKFEWNNFLHSAIERIFIFTLENESQVLKSIVRLFLYQLFLLKLVIKGSKSGQFFK